MKGMDMCESLQELPVHWETLLLPEKKRWPVHTTSTCVNALVKVQSKFETWMTPPAEVICNRGSLGKLTTLTSGSTQWGIFLKPLHHGPVMYSIGREGRYGNDRRFLKFISELQLFGFEFADVLLDQEEEQKDEVYFNPMRVLLEGENVTKIDIGCWGLGEDKAVEGRKTRGRRRIRMEAGMSQNELLRWANYKGYGRQKGYEGKIKKPLLTNRIAGNRNDKAVEVSQFSGTKIKNRDVEMGKEGGGFEEDTLIIRQGWKDSNLGEPERKYLGSREELNGEEQSGGTKTSHTIRKKRIIKRNRETQTRRKLLKLKVGQEDNGEGENNVHSSVTKTILRITKKNRKRSKLGEKVLDEKKEGGVSLTDLPKFISHLGHEDVDILKIVAPGQEVFLLQSFLEDSQLRVCQVLVSFSSDSDSVQNCKRLLKGSGYYLNSCFVNHEKNTRRCTFFSLANCSLK